MTKAIASNKRKQSPSNTSNTTEDDSEEDSNETEGEEEPQSKTSAASSTRQSHSLTEVVDKIKRNASSRSRQCTIMMKTASAPPTINASRSIDAIDTNAHPVDNNTMAENSNRERAALHSTSLANSHASPQVVNNGQGGDSSHSLLALIQWMELIFKIMQLLCWTIASTLSDTNGDNARSEIMLQQYFESLAQSGTIRNVVEEKILLQASWVLFSKESSSLTQIQTCQTRGILQRYI